MMQAKTNSTPPSVVAAAGLMGLAKEHGLSLTPPRSRGIWAVTHGPQLFERSDRARRPRKPEVDPFATFVDYITVRLVADPHMEARTLCDELEDLGFAQSYQTLTRQIRARGLRPICSQCVNATCRANAIIEHPAGEETQWDWVDLPEPPAGWGWGKTANLLVGSLAHSGRWRGYLAGDMTQPTLIDGPDRISRKHGGLTRVWRCDRMATVCHPDSGSVTATFAGVAKHYAVGVAICPAAAW